MSSAAATQPQPQGLPALQRWTWAHTVALAGIIVLLAAMGIWQPWGAFPSWIVGMISLLAFIVVAGHGINGQFRGALIDERNKISLSRFQMLAWTVVTLAGYATLVMARVYTNAGTALDVQVPEALWILMGISTTSLVGSPLVKSTKKGPRLELRPDTQDKLLLQGQTDPKKVRVEGQIVSNLDPSEAQWSDLFKGEEVANVSHLDLAKIQMFFFTLLLVLSYGVALGSLMRTNPGASSLPDVGSGMLALLGISHSGYLVNKAVTVTPPAAGQ